MAAEHKEEELATALAATTLDDNPLRALPEGVLGLSLEKLRAIDCTSTVSTISFETTVSRKKGGGSAIYGTRGVEAPRRGPGQQAGRGRVGEMECAAAQRRSRRRSSRRNH